MIQPQSTDPKFVLTLNKLTIFPPLVMCSKDLLTELKMFKHQRLRPSIKRWCIPPNGNAAFVAAMEDILEVYQRPRNPARPLVCLDEFVKQLVDQRPFTTSEGESFTGGWPVPHLEETAAHKMLIGRDVFREQIKHRNPFHVATLFINALTPPVTIPHDRSQPNLLSRSRTNHIFNIHSGYHFAHSLTSTQSPYPVHQPF